ncbi:MAG TPA: RNA pseudouridine synthase [Chromatiales bacterium]|nr:RNA pseudouridine synthase [Chromatiales bacterium]
MNDHPARFETHLDIDRDDAGAGAVSLLAAQTGLSKQRIKKIMQQGAVWLERDGHTRHLRRARAVLRRGDTLHLYYDARILDSETTPPELIADEGAYSVWYKPAGMLSQGSRWGDHCALPRWVEQHLLPQRPAFLVHRLDRAANGLMLLAHRKRTAASLSALFRERAIDKRYRVIVHGEFPPQGPITLDARLDGKTAISHMTRLAYDPEQDRSLLGVTIETGRKHQIRRHLASAGFAVVGDRWYGKGKETEDLQLTAWALGFRCPVSGQHREFALAEPYLPRL